MSSTGPRTIEGKARASKNATRHGLTSAGAVLVPGEALEDLERFTDALTASLGPVGQVEALLVERVVACAWRLRRVPRLEAARVAYEVEHAAHDDETFPTIARTYLSEQGREGGYVTERTEVLVNLSRYEAALERSMYRALHELERRQATRGGTQVSLPAVVDVDVRGDHGP
jgi:hypothetical protein